MDLFLKDPDASLDYSIDWGNGYLQSGETLATSTWTIFPSDMTEVVSGNTPNTATITVSGGVAGRIYQLTNRIGTSDGRTDERSVTIRVANR